MAFDAEQTLNSLTDAWEKEEDYVFIEGAFTTSEIIAVAHAISILLEVK